MRTGRINLSVGLLTIAGVSLLRASGEVTP